MQSHLKRLSLAGFFAFVLVCSFGEELSFAQTGPRSHESSGPGETVVCPSANAEARPSWLKRHFGKRTPEVPEIAGIPARGGDDLRSCRPGARCLIKIPEYPKRIAVWIPESNPNGKVMVHLHGYLNGPTPNFKSVLDYFNFGGVFANSSKKSLLIVPESGEKDSTFDEYFSRPGAFSKLVSSVIARLKGAGLPAPTRPRSIALSGHSGAGRAVQQIVDSPGTLSGALKQVTLLDATYPFRDTTPSSFVDWLKKGGRRLRTIFKPGTSTSERSHSIAAATRAAGVQGFSAEPTSDSHFSVGRDNLPGIMHDLEMI